MHKTLALVVLFLAPVLMAAQESKPQSDTGQTNKDSGLMTLEGCLQTDQGHYLLVDKEGMSQQLSGAAGKLRHLVKHQIEVSGEPGIETLDTTQSGIAATAAEVRVFRVKTVKELAKTCN